MKQEKRQVELVILSDIHLGTYGCHAKELLHYLQSIKPSTLVLNGDIIDIWQFKKYYWPKHHMLVVKHILGLCSKGVRVVYITGNHDETLRRFADTKIGKLEIVNKLDLNLDGKRAWIFHGDVFDVIMKHSKWLAKLGAIGYDALILLNLILNKIARLMGYERVSLSKKVKDNVKSAMKHINNFEETAALMAINKGYDYIVCGHIHQPVKREVSDEHGNSILYLNSGDWIENLSALEYNKGLWNVYQYRNDPKMSLRNNNQDQDNLDSSIELNNKEIFELMLNEFQK